MLHTYKGVLYMKKPKLEIICFCNEDVIATSSKCSVPATGYSEKSYQASRTYEIAVESGSIFTAYPNGGDPYNKVDGNDTTNGFGDVLVKGSWYHYGLDTFDGYEGLASALWWLCTDESHHYHQ